REIEEAAGSAAKEGKADAVRARFNEIGKRRAPGLAREEIGAAMDCGLADSSDPSDPTDPTDPANRTTPRQRGWRGGEESGSQLPHSKAGPAPLRRMIHPEVRVVDARHGI